MVDRLVFKAWPWVLLWICRLVSYISKQWLSGCRWIANAPLTSHSSRQYRTHPPQRRGEAPTMVEMASACASRSDSFIPDDPISISAFDSNHFQEEEWSNGCSNTGPVNIFLGQCTVASSNVQNWKYEKWVVLVQQISFSIPPTLSGRHRRESGKMGE